MKRDGGGGENYTNGFTKFDVNDKPLQKHRSPHLLLSKVENQNKLRTITETEFQIRLFL